MGFPSKKEIKEMEDKLKNVEGTFTLPKNASKLDKFRFKIQQEFVEYALEKELTNDEFSKVLGVHKSISSKILRNRIDEFSTDRLIKLLSIIKPDYSYDIRKSA